MPLRRKITDAKPDPTNARKHSDRNLDMITGSIQTAGFGRSILLASDDTIIAGNATAKAAAAAGLERMLVIDSDGTQAIAIRRTDVESGSDAFRRLAIADNRSAELAEWDTERLRQYEQDGLDLTQFFIESEYAALFPAEPKSKALTDPDEIPDLPIEPVSKPGDLYRLGRHTLLCGDATHGPDVDRLLAGRKPDLVVTDPPYGVAYVGKTKDALTIENDESSAGDEKVRALVATAMATTPLKPGGSFYVFSPAGRTELAFRLALVDAGLELRQSLCWVKHHFVMGRQDYQWRHESILYGWAPGAAHYFADDHTQDTVIERHEKLHAMTKPELLAIVQEYQRREKTSILREDRPARSELHPTIKPVQLIRTLITNSSKPKTLVYDGFGGSGTTMIAADIEDRACAMMEIDPRYVDVAVQRYSDYSGIAPHLER